MKLKLAIVILWLVIVPARAQYEVEYTDTLIDFGTGHKLRTEFCMPVGLDHYPVVIMRSPYLPKQLSISKYMTKQAERYARSGIGFMVQHCRGKGGSEGQFEPNIYEREDGKALIDWVNSQPWCSGIGLYGESYMALVWWIIGDILPEKVKGMYLHHYGVDRHLSAYNSGLFRQDILTGWAIDNATEPIRKPSKDDKDHLYFKEEMYMPQVTMDEDLLGAALPWYRDWITHTDYTDPYWHQGVWATLRSIPPQIKVPMTVVAGHFDHHNEGTILGYNLLSDETKARSRLIVGSWNHSHVTTPTVHQPKHDHDIDLNDDQYNWFVSLFKGEQPRHEVKVYAVGADEWVDAQAWPMETTEQLNLYFSPKAEKGKAYPVLSDANQLPKNKANRQFKYDPKNPVLSVGGETLFNSETRRGSREQPEVGYRDDVLYYETPAFTEDVTINGKIKGVFYMSTDVDDTSLTFKVSEVFPDGTAYNIRSGITTLAFRNNRLGDRQTYKSGEIVELEFEALPILWQVKKGHKLRIDITSSNFPEYSIHSNYAGVWSQQTQTRVATQSIYMCRQYPSHVEIPIGK